MLPTNQSDAHPVSYRDVPGIGVLMVSQHAQQRIGENMIPEELLRSVLYDESLHDIDSGTGCIWRERDGLRLVINPHVRVLVTVYRRLQSMLPLRAPYSPDAHQRMKRRHVSKANARKMARSFGRKNSKIIQEQP